MTLLLLFLHLEHHFLNLHLVTLLLRIIVPSPSLATSFYVCMYACVCVCTYLLMYLCSCSSTLIWRKHMKKSSMWEVLAQSSRFYGTELKNTSTCDNFTCIYLLNLFHPSGPSSRPPHIPTFVAMFFIFCFDSYFLFLPRMFSFLLSTFTMSFNSSNKL